MEQESPTAVIEWLSTDSWCWTTPASYRCRTYGQIFLQLTLKPESASATSLSDVKHAADRAARISSGYFPDAGVTQPFRVAGGAGHC